ncbi:hypothetical protein O181_032148 [Austropuccinia psidii MF-1]|uniref:Integrase catalytic domain-containing protein n=1 Tax=Austropuccinia psidii MF-1 TaxID=1389203 RepID=A0A9Q3D126_9BASI|nr:hypothetical protein [Austropuccinia psidii MF-1]
MDSRSTVERFGNMIQIQEHSSQLKIAHMDWVKALPDGADKRFNYCLVIVDRYRKTSIFWPFHKDEESMSTAWLIWNRLISHTCLFKTIIGDRDPEFTSSLWKTLQKDFGTKISFKTYYHPQTYLLAERMIHTLKYIIRRFCAYGSEFKYLDGLTNDWCTIIPELELTYKASIHASKGKTPSIL